MGRERRRGVRENRHARATFSLPRAVCFVVFAALAAWAPVGLAQTPRRAARLDRRIGRVDRARYADEWKTRWRNPRVLVDRSGVFVLVGGAPLADGAAPVADLASALVALPRGA